MGGDFWTKLKSNFQIPSDEEEKFQFKDTFFKDNSFTKKSQKQYALYGNKMYHYDDDAKCPNGVLNLDFDIKFTVLRDNNLNNKGQGRLIGFKVENKEAIVDMYNNNEQQIYKWREVFRNIINQRGFHELFKAHKKIGKGNFASVYLAERIEDDKFFAVKAFSKEAAYSQEFGKESLINEIEVMRQLDHASIIKLHEVFETQNSLYIILDLLNGGQLYDKIKNKHKFTISETRIVMKSLMDGLKHMHGRKIMHRDLKPENILFRVEDNMEVVIADLGLATRADLSEYMFVRCGTPGFVAPEVVNIKDLKSTYDPICDVYSAGLIFHILLLGKSPFNGKTYNEVLTLNRQANIEMNTPEYLKIPQDAFELLKKMLVRDPKNRITAKNAAEHPFFASLKKNEEFEVIEVENSQAVQNKMENLSLYTSTPVTPQMLPRNQQKKIDQDSCVDFKLGRSPIQTGRMDEYKDKEKLQAFESPAMQNSIKDKNNLKQMGKNIGMNTPDRINKQLDKNQPRPSLFNKLQEKEKAEKIEEEKEQPEKKQKVKGVGNKLKGDI